MSSVFFFKYVDFNHSASTLLWLSLTVKYKVVHVLFNSFFGCQLRWTNTLRILLILRWVISDISSSMMSQHKFLWKIFSPAKIPTVMIWHSPRSLCREQSNHGFQLLMCHRCLSHEEGSDSWIWVALSHSNTQFSKRTAIVTILYTFIIDLLRVFFNPVVSQFLLSVDIREYVKEPNGPDRHCYNTHCWWKLLRQRINQIQQNLSWNTIFISSWSKNRQFHKNLFLSCF